MKEVKSLAVFCGSSATSDQAIITDSLNLARQLCAKGIRLVYGGGNVGLMGLIADEMLNHKGEVIGVIPEKLVGIEVAHRGLTELHVVSGMHERKALMAGFADGFIILPGGIGTMEEFFEIFTWKQLGYHDKPVAIVNINSFYKPLLDFLHSMADRGFVAPGVIDQLIIEPDSERVLERMLDVAGMKREA